MREFHLLSNGAIVEGPLVKDKRGKPHARPIVVKLSLCEPELARAILELVQRRG